MEKINRIAVQMPNWLGDVVMALPVLQELHQLYPDAHIEVWSKKSFGPLYEFVPEVSKVCAIGRGPIPEADCDLGILLTNSFSSALRMFASGVKKRIGYRKEGRSWLLSESLAMPPKGSVHQSEQFLDLLSPLGRSDHQAPYFYKTEKHEQEAEDLWRSWGLPQAESVWAMSVSAAYGPAKQWPLKSFEQLALKVYEQTGNPVICLGLESDRELVQGFCQKHPAVFKNLAGQTNLKQLCLLLSRCSGFVGNDSGLSHLAAAWGCRVLSIFGSTSPAFTAPLGESVRTVSLNLPCAPCFKRTCPYGHKQCLEDLSVLQVWQEMEDWLCSTSR